MKMEKNKHNLLELYNYLNFNEPPEKVLNEIIKSIPHIEKIGYAGCLEKDWLKTLLKGFIFDKKGDNQYYLYNLAYGEKINTICKDAMDLCKDYLDKKTYIFLFPTFDRFIIEKMKGVNGFSSWNNTILIFINFVEGWENSLKETLVHEIAHSISPFYKGGDFSIGQGLILDGLAEHFKDFVIQGERSPWTKAISEEESWEIFEELKDKGWLERKDFVKYTEVFFGSGKYPNWAGYSIGYYLIKKYLRENKDIDWNSILRKNPKEILDEVLQKG